MRQVSVVTVGSVLAHRPETAIFLTNFAFLHGLLSTTDAEMVL